MPSVKTACSRSRTCWKLQIHWLQPPPRLSIVCSEKTSIPQRWGAQHTAAIGSMAQSSDGEHGEHLYTQVVGRMGFEASLILFNSTYFPPITKSFYVLCKTGTLTKSCTWLPSLAFYVHWESNPNAHSLLALSSLCLCLHAFTYISLIS